MATAVEQCRDGFKALQEYFESLSQYYSDGIDLPDEMELLDQMPFEEVLTYVSTNAHGGADFAIGAGVEAVQHFVAVERELAMTETTKSAIYISAISESDKEAEFYSQNSIFFSGVMAGAPTSGSQC